MEINNNINNHLKEHNKDDNVNKDDIQVEELKIDLFKKPDESKEIKHGEIVTEQVPEEYYLDDLNDEENTENDMNKKKDSKDNKDNKEKDIKIDESTKEKIEITDTDKKYHITDKEIKENISKITNDKDNTDNKDITDKEEGDLDKSDLSIEYVNYEDDKKYFDEGQDDEEEKPNEGEEDENSEENKEEMLLKQKEREKDIKREFDFKADGEIYCIALHESKGIVAIGDGEDFITFYDIVKKEVIKKEKLNKDSVVKVKLSNDNKYLAAASLDGTVSIFEFDNFKLINTLEGSYSDILWLEWHPKGHVCAFGCADGSVWVYNVLNTEVKMSFFGHTESVSAGKFSPDGKYLVTGSEDASLKIWDLKNQQNLHTLKGKKFHQSGLTTLQVCQSRNLIASASDKNEVCLTNIINANPLFSFIAGDEKHSIEDIEFCNDDKYIIFGGTDKQIQIFDLSSLQIRVKLPIGENISKIVVSKIKSYIAYISGSEGNFYVIDVRGNAEIISKDRLNSDVITDFNLTKEENYVVTCSMDKTINMMKIMKI